MRPEVAISRVAYRASAASASWSQVAAVSGGMLQVNGVQDDGDCDCIDGHFTLDDCDARTLTPRRRPRSSLIQSATYDWSHAWSVRDQATIFHIVVRTIARPVVIVVS